MKDGIGTEREITKTDLDWIKNKAQCIIDECDRWADKKPSAVYTHGYAFEKAEKFYKELK